MRQVVNDVFTSGLTMFRSVFSSHLLLVSKVSGAWEPSITATQHAFIVTTKPTSIAGQLSAVISLGAAISIATVKAILTISHKKNPNTAVPGFRDANRPVSPRANTAAGITTASAPYPADHPRFCLPVRPQATNATSSPATT